MNVSKIQINAIFAVVIKELSIVTKQWWFQNNVQTFVGLSSLNHKNKTAQETQQLQWQK